MRHQQPHSLQPQTDQQSLSQLCQSSTARTASWHRCRRRRTSNAFLIARPALSSHWTRHISQRPAPASLLDRPLRRSPHRPASFLVLIRHLVHTHFLWSIVSTKGAYPLARRRHALANSRRRQGRAEGSAVPPRAPRPLLVRRHGILDQSPPSSARLQSFPLH